MLKNIITNDREFVLNTINQEMVEEGLEPLKPTYSAIVTKKGIVWYEFVGENGYLSYATSYPFNRRRVTAVAEESEAHDFDEDVQ